MVKGKLIVNIDKKVFEGKSIKEWSTTPMTGEQARRVLSVIGIKFSNVPAFIESYESDEDVSDAVMFVLKCWFECDRWFGVEAVTWFQVCAFNECCNIAL